MLMNEAGAVHHIPQQMRVHTCPVLKKPKPQILPKCCQDTTPPTLAYVIQELRRCNNLRFVLIWCVAVKFDDCRSFLVVVVGSVRRLRIKNTIYQTRNYIIMHYMPFLIIAHKTNIFNKLRDAHHHCSSHRD